MQRAAIELARDATLADVGRLFGVSGEAIRKWTLLPEWGQYAAVAAAIVEGERRAKVADAAAASNIVPIRPGVTVQPPTEGNSPDDLVEHALKVVQTALTEGDVRAATWVLERVDPARFGTPKDRQIMAELHKAAADVAPRKVTVTVSAPAKRKAESA